MITILVIPQVFLQYALEHRSTQACSYPLNSYSFLNYDLSKVNIVNDAACSCGAPREDAFHYLFSCPNYTDIRRIMMNNLNWVQTSDLNLNLLTCGSDDLTYEENINIIKHVFNFIKSSKRFLVV